MTNKSPIVFLKVDGIGLINEAKGNLFKMVYTPNLNKLVSFAHASRFVTYGKDQTTTSNEFAIFNHKEVDLLNLNDLDQKVNQFIQKIDTVLEATKKKNIHLVFVLNENNNLYKVLQKFVENFYEVHSNYVTINFHLILDTTTSKSESIALIRKVQVICDNSNSIIASVVGSQGILLANELKNNIEKYTNALLGFDDDVNLFYRSLQYVQKQHAKQISDLKINFAKSIYAPFIDDEEVVVFANFANDNNNNNSLMNLVEEFLMIKEKKNLSLFNFSENSFGIPSLLSYPRIDPDENIVLSQAKKWNYDPLLVNFENSNSLVFDFLFRSYRKQTVQQVVLDDKEAQVRTNLKLFFNELVKQISPNKFIVGDLTTLIDIKKQGNFELLKQTILAFDHELGMFLKSLEMLKAKFILGSNIGGLEECFDQKGNFNPSVTHNQTLLVSNTFFFKKTGEFTFEDMGEEIIHIFKKAPKAKKSNNFKVDGLNQLIKIKNEYFNLIKKTPMSDKKLIAYEIVLKLFDNDQQKSFKEISNILNAALNFVDEFKSNNSKTLKEELLNYLKKSFNFKESYTSHFYLKDIKRARKNEVESLDWVHKNQIDVSAPLESINFWYENEFVKVNNLFTLNLDSSIYVYQNYLKLKKSLERKSLEKLISLVEKLYRENEASFNLLNKQKQDINPYANFEQFYNHINKAHELYQINKRLNKIQLNQVFLLEYEELLRQYEEESQIILGMEKERYTAFKNAYLAEKQQLYLDKLSEEALKQNWFKPDLENLQTETQQELKNSFVFEDLSYGAEIEMSQKDLRKIIRDYKIKNQNNSDL